MQLVREGPRLLPMRIGLMSISLKTRTLSCRTHPHELLTEKLLASCQDEYHATVGMRHGLTSSQFRHGTLAKARCSGAECSFLRCPPRQLDFERQRRLRAASSRRTRPDRQLWAMLGHHFSHFSSDDRGRRTAAAIAPASGWSMSSRAANAVLAKLGADRAMRPSKAMHSSLAIDDAAPFTSSAGALRNIAISTGRASLLPVWPSAQAADRTTIGSASPRRASSAGMSSSRA